MTAAAHLKCSQQSDRFWLDLQPLRDVHLQQAAKGVGGGPLSSKVCSSRLTSPSSPSRVC
jgi:hypothetical protein